MGIGKSLNLVGWILRAFGECGDAVAGNWGKEGVLEVIARFWRFFFRCLVRVCDLVVLGIEETPFLHWCFALWGKVVFEFGAFVIVSRGGQSGGNRKPLTTSLQMHFGEF